MSGASDDALPAPRAPRVGRSEVLLRGRVFDVVSTHLTLSSGHEQDLWIVEHAGAVAIAPVDERGELVLVRQYRHSARGELLEIPAGRLEAGEEPLVAAKRELAEETGYRAREWRELTVFLPAPGITSERITLFEARGLEPGPARPDDDEELEVLTMPLERVLAIARDGKTLIAAALLLLGR